MANTYTSKMTEHLLKIKQEVAASYPDFEDRATRAWKEIIDELGKLVDMVSTKGSECVPQVSFSELSSLSPERVDEIRRIGTVVIRDVVDDADARAWQESLKEFVKANPDVKGFPIEDKQFFELYWTKSQVQARSHPNILAATTWLNKLYRNSSSPGEQPIEGVDLSTPLTYADRFRIRHPGGNWDQFPPHIDGGSIERWEDQAFRTCFQDILSGDWLKHDPYALSGRLNARSSLYNRPNQASHHLRLFHRKFNIHESCQASVFRTFQGWLSMSETAPTEGTLKVFPDVLLSNAYIILRPFFRPLVAVDSEEILDPKNWVFDSSYPEFPGIYPEGGGGFSGPRPTPDLHPHMMLDKTMISVPKVMPGDTVFWHSDTVHSVENEHTGKEDSAVMYIPAMPTTPMNRVYVEKQRECFLKSTTPSDFPQGSEAFNGIGKQDDLLSPMGMQAMGFPIAV